MTVLDRAKINLFSRQRKRCLLEARSKLQTNSEEQSSDYIKRLAETDNEIKYIKAFIDGATAQKAEDEDNFVAEEKMRRMEDDS